jgi:molecular chaperone GrpE
MSEPNEFAPVGDEREAREAAAAVIDDLEKLRAKADERDQFLALLKRTQADFENYQKRNQREREQEWRYRSEGLVRDLLSVIDNLERAIDAAHQSKETGALVEGVELIFSQLLDVLKRHGVTPIDVKEGTPFDPNVHQAVMQKPSKDLAPNSVAQVFQRGYMIHDRVLRPASVVVSAAE